MSAQLTIEFVPAVAVFERAAWPLKLEADKQVPLTQQEKYPRKTAFKWKAVSAMQDKSARKVKTLFDVRSLAEAALFSPVQSIRLPDWHGPPGSAA